MAYTRGDKSGSSHERRADKALVQPGSVLPHQYKRIAMSKRVGRNGLHLLRRMQ
jgi:hypothetical protein